MVCSDVALEKGARDAKVSRRFVVFRLRHAEQGTGRDDDGHAGCSTSPRRLPARRLHRARLWLQHD